jgi:hypothetical protein
MFEISKLRRRKAVAIPTSSRWLFSVLPIALMAIAGADEAGAFGAYEWGDTKNTFADMDTAVNRTCFLSGIAGNLLPKSGKTPQYMSAGVRYESVTNRYSLYVNPVVGNSLRAFARCVNTAAGLTAEKVWSSTQNEPTKLDPVDDPPHPLRRCFLTSITSDYEKPPSGIPIPAFSDPSDSVRVFKAGDSWYLGGTQKGRVTAKARCIDVNLDVGSWQWGCGDPCLYEKDLALNTGGVTCFLTGLQGALNKNDWDHGALIIYKSSLLQFQMRVKNDITGWATCVK